ncbi:MAG: phosphoglucosamine mutase [Acidobacteria bacterium]|nr:phosphoglucosamine mutase [Acidobacteriota bacterium]
MAKQLFGTDGIRGKAGQYPLDPSTAYAVGLALAQTLGGGAGGRTVIGMDTRASGPELAELLAAGLAAGGLETEFAGVLPTAGVSYLTETGGYRAGVMISASHNPFDDNGIKVFAPTGFKLADAVEHVVEEAVFRLLEQGVEPRRAALTVDASLRDRYLAHILWAGRPAAEIAKRRVVVDCANGAASPLAAEFFRALGAEAEIFANEPDGLNINRDCGSLHLDKLQRRVVETGADLGVAFDGDADRALFVADDGEIVDGDAILLLAGEYLAGRGELPLSRVVTTVMANMGLEKALAASGVSMTRTAVGDKYVLEEMVSTGAGLGGEQSGHIIFKQWANTGDGLLTAKMMLEVLSEAGAPLSELRKRLQVFPQKLVNVRVTSRPKIEDVPALAAAAADCENALGDRGRLVLRYSGTEPLARIMIEAETMELVETHCEALREAFVREIGA